MFPILRLGEELNLSYQLINFLLCGVAYFHSSMGMTEQTGRVNKEEGTRTDVIASVVNALAIEWVGPSVETTKATLERWWKIDESQGRKHGE